MSLFQRHLAPLDASVWALLEAQSSDTLKANLNGRLQDIDNPGFDIQCGIRQVQPMIEARKTLLNWCSAKTSRWGISSTISSRWGSISWKALPSYCGILLRP